MLLKISYTFKLTGGPFIWVRGVAGNQKLKKSSPMIRYRILARLIKLFLRLKVTTQLRGEAGVLYVIARSETTKQSRLWRCIRLLRFARNDNLLPPLTVGLRIKISRHRKLCSWWTRVLEGNGWKKLRSDFSLTMSRLKRMSGNYC